MQPASESQNPCLIINLQGDILDAEHSRKRRRNLDFLSIATTRRKFLKISAAGGLSVAAICLLENLIRLGEASPLARVVMADAQGVILSDPVLCVGCRRCELACTEFNRGEAHPATAGIKIYRNLMYGPEMVSGNGLWGNLAIYQETCKQCPDPVPCASACIYGAIYADAETGARTVDPEKCVGCKACQDACPYGMTSFDEARNVSTKCHLCSGSPQCVANCPTGALSYVPWVDTRPDGGVVPPSPEPPDDGTEPNPSGPEPKTKLTQDYLNEAGRTGCFINTLKQK